MMHDDSIIWRDPFGVITLSKTLNMVMCCLEGRTGMLCSKDEVDHVVDHPCQTSGKSNQCDIFSWHLFFWQTNKDSFQYSILAQHVTTLGTYTKHMQVWKFFVVCQSLSISCLNRFREARRFKNGWISVKFPNGLWPPPTPRPFLGRYTAIFSANRMHQH